MKKYMDPEMEVIVIDSKIMAEDDTSNFDQDLEWG